MTNRTITYQDRKNAARLLKLWNRKKDELNLTQTKLADMWGLRQSAISQYLNGAIALNTDIVLKFAKALNVSPLQIDPTLLEHLLGTGTPMAWIAAEDFIPEPAQMYYAIDAATKDQHVVRWTKDDEYVDIHTGAVITPSAVLPALPPPV